MNQFYQQVDLQSRKAMVDFLTHHFRYYTMNSWNRTISYANNVKIHSLDLQSEAYENAFEIMEQGDVYDEINHLLADFDREHTYQCQAGFNGRSGGYIVLYQGGYNTREYFPNSDRPDGMIFSDYFSRWFDKEEAEAHPLYDKTYKHPFTWPGKGVDQ